MMIKIIAVMLMVTSQVFAFAPQKMISYNIRQDTEGDKGVKDWQQRMPNVVKFLQEQQPSVIGLQEVRNNQLEDLEKNLPDYGKVGVGREDGIAKGEYSPILYDKSVWRMDEKESGTFWLSDTPDVPNSKTWGNGYTRICTWVRLIDKAGSGKGIYIYNTHWDHQSQPSREKAAVLILKMIKQRKNKAESCILMGDFNATTKNPAVKTLLIDGSLIDHGKQQMKTSNYWKAALKVGLRIDHIFVSPELKKAEVKVVATGDPPASDHHPIVMTVDLAESASGK
jgi:endonuclease/exonuclease/phosphatase family metal-dependent hydrolase